MKLKYEFAINKIENRYYAVPLWEKEKPEFKGVVNLNETGAFVLQQLNEALSLGELEARIQAKFGCTSEEAAANAAYMVKNLREANLLTES